MARLPAKQLPSYERTTLQQHLLDVQRTAGNWAARELVQRQPLTAGAPLGTDEANQTINRGWLVDRIAFRMGLAFNKFIDACNDQQRALREIAKEQAEFLGVLLDVVLVFATPGLSGLVRRALAPAVWGAAGNSAVLYKLAVGAVDRSDQIVSATTALGKKPAIDAVENALRRSEAEQYVEALKQSFSVTLDGAHASLPVRSDAELALLYLNYDPEIATKAMYLNQISTLVARYERQVAPIGTGIILPGPGDIVRSKHKAVWVKMGRGTYLALVEHTTGSPGASSSWTGSTSTGWAGRPRLGAWESLSFVRWLGMSMRDLAIEKTKQKTGEPPRTVGPSDVNNLPWLDLAYGMPLKAG